MSKQSNITSNDIAKFFPKKTSKKELNEFIERIEFYIAQVNSHWLLSKDVIDNWDIYNSITTLQNFHPIKPIDEHQDGYKYDKLIFPLQDELIELQQAIQVIFGNKHIPKHKPTRRSERTRILSDMLCQVYEDFEKTALNKGFSNSREDSDFNELSSLIVKNTFLYDEKKGLRNILQNFSRPKNQEAVEFREFMKEELGGGAKKINSPEFKQAWEKYKAFRSRVKP